MFDARRESIHPPNEAAPMPIERLGGADVWVFDLDNTLYPAACDVFGQVERNMTRFIMERFALGRDDAYAKQKSYFRNHGTTMSGLMRHDGVDPSDFLAFVHDIDLSPIPDNPAIEPLLASLPGRKIIFTNGSVGHADRITRHMGIDHHFEGVFDIVASNYVPKPEPSVYDVLIERFDIDPTKAVMVEDMAKNLAPAAALGMTTVWIETHTPWGREMASDGFVHHTADDLTRWLGDVVEAWFGAPQSA